MRVKAGTDRAADALHCFGIDVIMAFAAQSLLGNLAHGKRHMRLPDDLKR